MKRRKGFGIVNSDQKLEKPVEKKEKRSRSRKRKQPTNSGQSHSDQSVLRNANPSDIPPTYIKFISTDKDLPPNEHKNIIVWDEWGFDIEKADIVRQHILDDVQSRRYPRTKYWAKLEK